MNEAPLGVQQRVLVWDAALGGVRAYFRGEGSREVSTAVRVDAVAIEPFIEPIAAGGQWLATSPELAMKRLVAAGAGPIFQIAPVFRAAESGARHSEEFRLVEWYRPGDALGVIQRDVEALVATVFAAVGTREGPTRWETHGWLDLVAATTGLALSGNEDAEQLRLALAGHPQLHASGRADAAPTDVATLAAWTTFITLWSDTALDPWLSTRDCGVHIVEFPPALAALSELGAPVVTRRDAARVAFRVESHVAGVELANGYRELRDAAEQRVRFATVQGLRAAYGSAPLPMPEAFVSALVDPGLPPTIGCALGLDRLVMLACGRTRLSEVALSAV